MQHSAEARLWWQGPHCRDVEAWFEALSEIEAGGGPPIRKDLYVRDPEQAELGIKVRKAGTREERLEVKSLVDRRGDVVRFGPVTIWTKSASNSLRLGGTPTIMTYKLRRLRKFGWDGAGLDEIPLDREEISRSGARPDAGCNVEFTKVTIDGSDEVWWTLGYEAFGELGEIEEILHACIEETLVASTMPDSSDARPGSYPEWLGRVTPRD